MPSSRTSGRCSTISRSCGPNFRADGKGQIKLLEGNPNPGWCWDGKLNIMAGFQGIRYSELLGQILAAAEERLGIVAKPQATGLPAIANGASSSHVTGPVASAPMIASPK